MVYLLVLFPLAIAAVTFSLQSEQRRRWMVPLAGTGQLALVAWTITQSKPEELSGLGGWLLLDALGKVVLGFISVLFFVCALYTPGYLALRPDRPNRVFCTNLLASLAMMTLVTLSHHLGLMWVAMEATTLLSAPSIYFNHNARSLEATWKYLLIGSVGIALALFGSFFLAYSALKVGLETTLLFDQLIAAAPELSPPWLHAGFVLLFVGYGTKMGLAPMHTWKPDAYGEAPGMVGALLAGGVTSCAFLAILRIYQICRAGPEAEFAQNIMVLMGLFSMAVAAVFMVRQRDFKRMLAYSSIEHMGILVLGVGIGGAAIYGALLHLINNGLTKGVLFLSAGNIHRAYGSKVTDHVHGAIRRVPLSGALFLLGFLAITGSPPFAPFVSEFTIVSEAMNTHQFWTGGLFLTLMAIVFMGMGATVLSVVLGKPDEQAAHTTIRDSLATSGPILIVATLVVLLGIVVPAPLQQALREAAALLGG
ncbi:MAG TPA: proton-conducting transporter membrane subunit [Pirellulales bacterium]|jgi:hydrogenase-4 component F|nr:proton-conducting transporter membrane subunit [Pirellulales bacterium]